MVENHAKGCAVREWTGAACTCGFDWWAAHQGRILPMTSSVIAPNHVIVIPTGYIVVSPTFQPFTREQALGETP
jgi:hypothetical protein